MSGIASSCSSWKRVETVEHCSTLRRRESSLLTISTLTTSLPLSSNTRRCSLKKLTWNWAVEWRQKLLNPRKRLSMISSTNWKAKRKSSRKRWKSRWRKSSNWAKSQRKRRKKKKRITESASLSIISKVLTSITVFLYSKEIKLSNSTKKLKTLIM